MSKFALNFPFVLWMLVWGGYAVYLICTGKPFRRYGYYSMFRRNRPREAHFEPAQPLPTLWLRIAGVALLASGAVDLLPLEHDPTLDRFILIFIFLPLYLIGLLFSYRSRRVL